MTEFALDIRQLSKTYANGKVALDHVSLKVPAGAFYALLGPNGAGKSTLINILADVVRPGGGAVKMFGRDLFRERGWCKRRLGVVPQEVAFDPFFSPREVLRITSGMFGRRPEEDWIDELLERLELSEHAEKTTRQLSGGMRRRLLVAQALVHRPRLVVLDEPTAGVDVELRRRLWAFMRELNAAGTTILLTTHYLEEAESLCERVAIIHRGRVVADRRMQDLLHETAGRYLWLKYGPDFVLHDEDKRALAAFAPRSEGRTLLLKLIPAHTHAFHEAYQAAVRRFGAPLDAGVRQEDLEDVFMRLTGTQEEDA